MKQCPVIPALASAPANRPFQQGTQCLQVETPALCRTALAEPHQQQPDREGRNGPGTLKEIEEVTEMRNNDARQVSIILMQMSGQDRRPRLNI